jgi:uncharacterized protein (DUF1778 family)
MNTTLETQGGKIELRATKAQKQIIEQAAQAEGVNVKAFIFSRIIPEATRILGERSVFVLNAVSWDRFNAILDRPAKPNAKLRDLASSRSVLV